MGAVLRLLLRVAMFAATTALAVWMAAVWSSLELAFGIWAIAWLIGLRTPVAHRHQHSVILLAVGVLSLAYASAVWWLVDAYVAAVASFTAHLDPLLQWIGVSLPTTSAAAFPLINVLFLALCVGLKVIALSGTPLARWAGAAGADGLFTVAYRLRETRWRLKPWWLVARVFGPMLLTIGGLLFLRQWWLLLDNAFAGWVSLLPSALIAIGLEWHLWLSGEVDEHFEPAFAGRDTGTAKTLAVFEDLWRRYRRLWPDHWRAAGNRGPEFPNG